MGSNHEVAGQTAIITGAGSGIGAATAILMTLVVGGRHGCVSR